MTGTWVCGGKVWRSGGVFFYFGVKATVGGTTALLPGKQRSGAWSSDPLEDLQEDCALGLFPFSPLSPFNKKFEEEHEI